MRLKTLIEWSIVITAIESKFARLIFMRVPSSCGRGGVELEQGDGG
jgi:hypothetical protein